VTAEIRTPDVDYAASKGSAVPGVREALVAQQREMGREGGVVMDGRDIGTHVFPGADVKFFLAADPTVRAGRRWTENEARGRAGSLGATLSFTVYALAGSLPSSHAAGQGSSHSLSGVAGEGGASGSLGGPTSGPRARRERAFSSSRHTFVAIR
jgi:hypothetical protein